MGLPLRWDYDQMINILAVELRRKPEQPGKPGPEPSPRPLFDANFTERKVQYACCGKPGHLAPACPTVCAISVKRKAAQAYAAACTTEK